MGYAITMVTRHYTSLPDVQYVSAATETDVFDGKGDRVDDAAIWINGLAPQRSLIIASIKDYGLISYDMTGRTVQELPIGDVDNVDIRQDFSFSGRSIPLIAASNRDNNQIVFYTVEKKSLRLIKLPQAELITGNQLYGLCLHKENKTGNISVFATSKQGIIEQWMVYQDHSGFLKGVKIRQLNLDTIVESCVADDDTGRVYLAEENHGIVWVNTDPTRGNKPLWVDRIISGVLKQDVEGLAIYKTGLNNRYLLASSQGNSTIVVYDLNTNHCLGRFHISGNVLKQVDEVTHTDGIAATSANLGQRFPRGILVVQDDANEGGEGNQNLKLVPFQKILDGLGKGQYNDQYQNSNSTNARNV